MSGTWPGTEPCAKCDDEVPVLNRHGEGWICNDCVRDKGREASANNPESDGDA